MSNEGERLQLSTHLTVALSLLSCVPLVRQTGSVIKAL